MKKTSILAAVLIIVGFAFIAWQKTDQGWQNKSDAGMGNTTLAEVLLPSTLSDSAQIGKRAFEAKLTDTNFLEIQRGSECAYFEAILSTLC